MNDEYFVSGGITDNNPILLAFLSDNYGINTVGTGIGHDIIAILDDNPNELYVLNDYYESDVNSYQEGKVEYQFFGLNPGKHNIKLKVWDIFNNSSEKSIDFEVIDENKFIINRLYNYPNPFSDFTYFNFEHNQPDKNIEIIIDIMTLSGELVKTIKSETYSDGYRIDPIFWDGKNDSGNKISSGIYIYRLKVRFNGEKTIEKFEKLVIL